MATSIPVEPAIEPDIPIVDAHHHLWFIAEPPPEVKVSPDKMTVLDHLAEVRRRQQRYLYDEFLADLRSGHKFDASVFVECHMFYRPHGPEKMKSVGEVEFANGVAAMAASGIFGEEKVCAGIVGGVDLSLGDAVEEVLVAHLQAGGGRYRGIRDKGTYFDEDETIFGAGVNRPRVLLDKNFRAGVKQLEPLGLSLDVFILEPQLPELIDLANAFPDTRIIVNHVGGPVGTGRYTGKREERFPIWRDNMRELARNPNISVKLGGLAMPILNFKSLMSGRSATSAELAEEWKPYIDSCIDAFGVDRCMFESNFPIDSATCSFSVLWNAFKRLTSGASRDEKIALFSGTAKKIYRLNS
jgi:predicted TIM-barrel fold metal-dependent hydrolase